MQTEFHAANRERTVSMAEESQLADRLGEMQQILEDLEVKMESNEDEKQALATENMHLDVEIQNLTRDRLQMISQI